MTNEVIEHLKRYCDGKENTEKVEISVLQLHRIIKALEQQTCEDAISRQSVLNALGGPSKVADDDVSKMRERIRIIKIIDNLPSVNPQHTDEEIQKMQELEQAEIQKAYELGKTEGSKIGHWIRQTDEHHDYYYECDQCGIVIGVDDIKNFCPNCGAKMIKSQESEEQGMKSRITGRIGEWWKSVCRGRNCKYYLHEDYPFYSYCTCPDNNCIVVKEYEAEKKSHKKVR